MKKNRLSLILLALLTVVSCAVYAFISGSSQALPVAVASADTMGDTVTVNETAEESTEANEFFTERDLEQTADLSNAVYYTVSDGATVSISEEGVYVLTGSASNATVYVNAPDDAKVQLVLEGLKITNSDTPCIYVENADKVFVTTSADSSLSVTGTFQADGGDGTIFSRSDLVLNGTATLTISSTDNGVVSKDDLKITGGTYRISASSKAIDANDSIRIADGNFTLNAGTDGLHAENNDDDTLGWIYIGGGTLAINAGDDGIHATSLVQIDGGSITISAAEGIEGTYIKINDGVVYVQATDDGINAAQKSSAYRATLEINGGEITVAMSSGDTDGIDSNGDIYVNGGTINVTGNSTFDCDGTVQYNGGTLIVNGQQVNYIPNQMMGGGMMGGGMMAGMGNTRGGMNRGGFGR